MTRGRTSPPGGAPDRGAQVSAARPRPRGSEPLLRIARGPHELPSATPRAAAARREPGDEEHCELCAAGILEDHRHLMHMGRRALLCVCRACYLLFTHDGAARGLFRSVPERYIHLAPDADDQDWWNQLQVPVSLVFFVRGSDERVRAFYAGPAGATEAELDVDTWDEVVRRHPVVGSLAMEVEALLVRAGAPRLQAFIVPIDACFELVGRLRQNWRGFTGGDEPRAATDAFFDRIALLASQAPAPAP
jgi:hypothetical protein